MQAVEVQRSQQIRSLEVKFTEKMEELKETYAQVSYKLECNDFANAIGQFLQLHKMNDDLQAKDKQISQLEGSLEEKKSQLRCIQAEKQSSDAATQCICLDVVECKSTTFLVLTILYAKG